MDKKSIRLHVITPSKMFYEGDIEIVIANTPAGEEGFMANHAWCCKLLDVEKLWIKEAGAKDFKVAAVSGGFIDIMEEIIIFTDSAEWPEDIDTERALAEQAKAENWLLEHKGKKETNPAAVERAKANVSRQKLRLGVAKSEGMKRK